MSEPIENTEVGGPAIIIVWDPSIVSAEQYKQLVESLGDLVRAKGGIGLERIRSETFTISAGPSTTDHS